MTSKSDSADARMFKEVAAQPYYWEMSAMALKLAADLSWQKYMEAMQGYQAIAEAEGQPLVVPFTDPEPGLQVVSFMLYGSAIECMLKEALLHWEKGETTEQYSHDLVKLASAVEANFSDAQNNTLAELTTCIEWRGRYPTPKRKRFNTASYTTTLTIEDIRSVYTAVDEVRHRAIGRYYAKASGVPYD